LDGTGKLFAEFVRVMESDLAPQIVTYPKDRLMSYAQLEELVRAALPDDRPYFILGESFGGPIAIRIAANPPAGLLGVILCVSFAKNPYPFLAWAKPIATRLSFKSLPRWVRAPLMWGSTDPGRAPQMSERASAEVAEAVLQQRIGALLSVDESAALARIALPLLVLRARHDRVIPRAASRWIQRTLPQAQLLEIDGPHLLLQTRPAACAAAILKFMRGIA
jgi:pimeloyl-[acyl-carrier protein] methyl ester esterase